MKIRYIIPSTSLAVTTEQGNVREIEFDATLREHHTTTAQATEHKVEKGAPITDHVIVAPKRVTVEVVVTNSPMQQPNTNMDGVTSRFDNGVLQFSGEVNRVKSVYDEIEAIIDNVRLVDLVGGLRDYDDMILENLSVPRSGKDGESITFTFDAKHITFAEIQTTAAPQKTHKRTKRGAKGAKEVKKPSKERESFAHAALRALGVGN